MPFAKNARLLLAALMLCPSAAMAASDSFSGLLDGWYGYSRVPIGNASPPGSAGVLAPDRVFEGSDMVA